MWTQFVMDNQHIELSTFALEWRTTLDILWGTVDHLKMVFAGTPFPLHLGVVEKWREFFSPKTSGWMISVLAPVKKKGEGRIVGFFHGPRTGSHLYDFRRRGCLVFNEVSLDFEHHVSSTPFCSQREALDCLGVLRY